MYWNMTQEEIWKPIKGYEGLFEISNKGRVKSLEKYVSQGTFLRHVPEHILSVYINAYGYPCISLRKKGKKQNKLIHRLLMEAFVPNPENKPDVDHLNGDKMDFRLENLKWVSPKENMNNPNTIKKLKDSFSRQEVVDKRMETNRLQNAKNAPRRVFAYSLDGYLLGEFKSLSEASRSTGATLRGIKIALDNSSKTSAGFLWTTQKRESIEYKKPFNGNAKPLKLLSGNGAVVKTWPSLSEAAKELGISIDCLSSNLKKNMSYKDLKFSFL